MFQASSGSDGAVVSSPAPASPEFPTPHNVERVPVPVSVIIPCYNYARFLRDAVDSVLAQSAPVLEILLIDDGSTDETPELAVTYPAPVRYIQQANAGLSAARNRGIAEAQGEFVAFLDADDAFEPRMIERCVAEFARLGPDWGLVAVESRGINVEGKPFPRREQPWKFSGEVRARDLVIKNRFVPTVMVRRAIFDQVGGFDPELRSSEDREMWIRVATVSRVWLLDEVLALKRSHGSNMSGNGARQSANIEKVLRKTEASGKVGQGQRWFWAKAWSFYYFQSALMLKGNGNWRGAFGNLLRSMVLWPWHGDRVALLQPGLFRLRWLARFILEYAATRMRPASGEGKAS